jgi:rhamnogalacturonyl hydrolase YesR
VSPKAPNGGALIATATIWTVVLPVWGQQQTPLDGPDLFSREHILSTMEKVADWQLGHLVDEAPLRGGDTETVNDTSWIRGALFTGVMATFKSTGKQKYLDAAREVGERNNWQPGPRPRHADDHCIAQTYAELYLLERDERMIEPIRSRFDVMIAKPKLGSEVGWSKKRNWSWCDALFMAPPAMALVSEATGDRKYLDLMDTLWWETYDYLFDREEQLWYRDGSFVVHEDGAGPRTANGEKIFWGRGNGWVLAGLARVLQHMPADYPHRPRYEELMRQMAARLIGLQGEDGLWRASLLDPAEYPAGETSSSGFFAFGLAWGINNGVLDAKTYLPAVKRSAMILGLSARTTPWNTEPGHSC